MKVQLSVVEGKTDIKGLSKKQITYIIGGLKWAIWHGKKSSPKIAEMKAMIIVLGGRP